MIIILRPAIWKGVKIITKIKKTFSRYTFKIDWIRGKKWVWQATRAAETAWSGGRAEPNGWRGGSAAIKSDGNWNSVTYEYY